MNTVQAWSVTGGESGTPGNYVGNSEVTEPQYCIAILGAAVSGWPATFNWVRSWQ